MKFQIKALSTTLVLASLLGACSSVNSSTPSIEEPSANTSIELESSEGFEAVEEVPVDSAEIATPDYQATEEPTTELDSAEMETPDYQATEEPTTELDSAEMETPDYQATEEPTIELDSAEMETPDYQATEETEAPQIESSEAPVESDGSGVILPIEDAQTPTESEAAENSTLEPGQ